MAIVISYDELYTDPKIKYTSLNPTGYRYRVFHPSIRPLWDLYCKKQGIPKHFPASDKQRHEFERNVIDQLIASGRIVVRHLSR
jgi:hypothetical protein